MKKIKNEKTEDMEIIEQNRYNTKRKTKTDYKKNKTYIFIICLVLIVLVAFIIALKNIGFLKLDWANSNKAELNYTNPSNTVKEGIYLTDVSAVVEEVMPSIVAITSKTLVSSGLFGPSFYGEQQYTEGAGSGIIISKNDNELLILTNNHVVEGAEALSVRFVNEKSVDAVVKGTSERKDIAVISLKIKDLDKDTLNAIKIATIGDSTKLKVGNGIIAIGNSLGYGQTVTTGVVGAINRSVEIEKFKSKMIQIDAAINGGNSGGALLNSKGEVVGINSAKYSSNGSSTSIEGMGFAIPITDVKELITSLMNGEKDEGGATLGVEGYMVNDAQSKSYGMPVGFYIQKVVDGSAAAKAGLEKGDIITEAAGEKINKLTDLTNILYDSKKGDKLKVKISYPDGREYKEKEVEVTLQ